MLDIMKSIYKIFGLLVYVRKKFGGIYFCKILAEFEKNNFNKQNSRKENTHLFYNQIHENILYI